MAVSGIQTTTTAPTATKQDGTITGFANNFDTFLQLLTTQLKNQDPLSPLSATEFTTQLVQFTSVEQAIRQNQTLDSLLSLQKSTQTTSAVSFLGKTVEAKGDTAQMTNGRAEFGYSLEAESTTTKLQILDSQGNIVRTAPGKTTAGAQNFVWDGRDDNGKLLTEGTYTVRVTASDATGKAVATSTNISGRVTNVSLDGDAILLSVGPNRLRLADVLSVRDTPIN